MDVSPRMARHLAAAGHPVPTANVCPTGKELVGRLLAPVGDLPEVATAVRYGASPATAVLRERGPSSVQFSRR